MAINDCYRDYNLAEKCGLTSDMTYGEIADRVIAFVNEECSGLLTARKTYYNDAADNEEYAQIRLSAVGGKCLCVCYGRIGGTSSTAIYAWVDPSTSTTSKNNSYVSTGSLTKDNISLLRFYYAKSKYGIIFGLYKEGSLIKPGVIAVQDSLGRTISLAKFSNSGVAYTIGEGAVLSDNYIIGGIRSDNAKKTISRYFINNTEFDCPGLYKYLNKPTTQLYRLNDGFYVDLYRDNDSYAGLTLKIEE